MLVVYVGTHDEVEIDGGPIAVKGEPVEVPDELAGSAPSGERWTEGYDPGAGLLAQVDNWAPATPAPVKVDKTPPAPPVTPPADGATEGKTA